MQTVVTIYSKNSESNYSSQCGTLLKLGTWKAKESEDEYTTVSHVKISKWRTIGKEKILKGDHVD